MRLAGLILLCLGLASPAIAADWISAARAPQPVVLHLRRDIVLKSVPRHLWAEVSADNRFVLYVNGRRAASGPATSDLAAWRYERVDLAPYMKPGENHIAAVVWNFVTPGDIDPGQQTGPMAQQTETTGFWLKTGDTAYRRLDSGADWRVHTDAGHGVEAGMAQIDTPDWLGYYVAGAPEKIVAATADRDWRTGDISAWDRVVTLPGRAMSIDPLPAMTYDRVASGKVVRGGGPLPLTIAAHSHVALVIQRPDMISAYPELRVSGGDGAVIRVTYSEAPYVAGNRRGVRDDPSGEIRGLTDSFTSDGRTQTFAPLWWRTWRFVQIDVTTRDAPLRLEDFATFATGYPFRTRGEFHSDDPALDDIWRIGWRTARLDAHETYMDSAYWEQLQYVGDTRIQMLMSYAVAGDPRLAVNAIDAFGRSDTEGGLTEGAYPSRGHNAIAPFSLLWIGQLHDYWMNEPDAAPVARNLARARRVLAWFRPYLHDDGLLGKNPTWNFVDWVGKDRDAFPSFDRNGESCLTSLIYLGALQQAADLEAAEGDKAVAAGDTATAAIIRAGVRAQCWDGGRRLYADDPSKTLFSQHANALAVLYDVASPQEAPELLRRITTGHGIDAPADLIPVSYYFSWYLVRALEHAGRGDDYVGLLQTWRELLPLHFSTWPEARLETRSDSHAWSGHPTADLLAIVAGIEPGAPGYASLRVAPHPGTLKRLHAVAMTPAGAVTVDYGVMAGRLSARISRPANLPGVFVWRGRTYALPHRVSRFDLAF